jgi:hypothetical protein
LYCGVPSCALTKCCVVSVGCGKCGRVVTPLVLSYSEHTVAATRSNCFSIEREGAVCSLFFAIKFKLSGNVETDSFIFYVWQTFLPTVNIHI